MPAVVVVQVAARPIVDVLAMRDSRMAAACAVLVRLGVDAALVFRRADFGMAVRHEEQMVVDVVAVLVVQVAVVQVVLVPVVQDLVVAAAVRVVVRVVLVLLAVVHADRRQSACHLIDCLAVPGLVVAGGRASGDLGLSRRRHSFGDSVPASRGHDIFRAWFRALRVSWGRESLRI